MNRLNTLLCAIVLLLCGVLLPVRAGADPADIQAAARSVVRVVLISDDGQNVALYGHGSGFAVAPDLVLTNAHVVADMADNPNLRVLVIPSEGQRGFTAKVAAFSAHNDLALIRIPKPVLPVATLSPMQPQDGQQVYAVGYPGNVDLAQGLDEVDMITPTPPVKTLGTVSTGRSSKSFDTVLHTAPIAAGNSGGPLMDGCGRVVGANSFGTLSDGSDSDFFFAVSMREILPFLRGAGVAARSNNTPCQSMADFDRAEAERLAGQRAQDDAQTRALHDKRSAAEADAARKAEMEVFSARENGLLLAGVALLFSLGAAGGALWLGQQGKLRERKFAAIAAAALLLGAIAALVMRPSLDSIDTRARELADAAVPLPSPSAAASGATSGAMRCVLDPQRSRVTVSDTSDVPIEWSADGCMNKRSQYGLGADGWSRVLVPGGDQTVTVARFDPATRTYTTERYLLELDAMAKLRAARGKVTPPSCGAGEAAARQLGDAQAGLHALLPAQPNERLVFHCEAAPAGAKL